MYLRLFGGLRIDAESVGLSGRALHKKRLAILALLGATPGARLSRDKLSALLWPESDTERARHQLASSIYELRKALGEAAIVSVGDDLLLAQDVMRSDVADFDEFLAAGNREQAIALYVGPFLDGFFVADAPELERWIETERSRLSHAYARALETLAADTAARGHALAAIDWWRKLAGHDPYNARVAVRLAQALDAAGDRAGALRHALMHAETIRTHLDVEPDPEVVSLIAHLRGAPTESKVAGSARLSVVSRSASNVGVDDSHDPVVVADGAPTGVGPRPAALDQAKPRLDRRLIAVGAAVVIAALTLAGITGQWQRTLGAFGIDARGSTTQNEQPVVVMMDSPHPSRVYDEETVMMSGTNADILNDVLRDLPIRRVKETAGPFWHRHEEVRQLRPDLVVVHLSAFCQEECEPQRLKMRAFIEYLADTDTQFLIYSRMSPETFMASCEEMLGDLPQRFPSLRTRIHTFAVRAHGSARWKDPATASAFKLRVKELLDLR